MRRLITAVLLTSGLFLAGPPASAQTVSDPPDLIALLDVDGEPCTGVPNQLPGVFDFSAACEAHDLCFEPGGDNSACDEAFRQDLFALCVAQHPAAWDPLRYLCFTFAELYHQGALFFGPIVFP